MGVYLAEVDLLRRKAESKMQMGGGFPRSICVDLVHGERGAVNARKITGLGFFGCC